MDPQTTNGRPSRRRLPNAAAIAFLLCLGAADAASTPPTGHDAVNRSLGLAGSELITLDVEPSPQPLLTIGLTIGGDPYTFDLLPHSVRSEGFAVLEQHHDGRRVPIDPGPPRTFRGAARELPGSTMAGGLSADGLRAAVTLPHVEGRYWIQPAPQAGPGAHVLYHDLDRRDPPGDCGVADDAIPIPVPAEPHGGGVAGGDDCLWVAELAVDTDFPFFEAVGGPLNVVSRVEVVINAMNLQYERDVQITHQIGTIIIRPTDDDDPYSSTTSPSELLNELRSFWNAEMTDVERDVVQLFTGRDLSGTVIGIAWVGSVCNSFQYSVVQNFGGFSCQTDLSAHELGHNWSAGHCSCPSNTMNSGLTCSNVFNPLSTVPSIMSFRNAIAGCLDNTCAVPNDQCTNAASVGAGSFPFDTTEAFTDGPPETLCGGGLSQINDDVWYRFFSDCNGPVDVGICDATFDTRLAVYESFCPIGAFSAIACDDDGCGEQSSLTFEAEDGEVYLIRVGGRDGAFGQGTLVIDADACMTPVVNDDCGDGTTIGEGTVDFTTVGATTDGPEENPTCGLNGSSDVENDVWYRFLGDCDGTATVRVCDADFDALVAVYEGPCPIEPEQAIGCAVDGCGSGFLLSFPVTNGSIYRVRIGGAEGATGTGTLELVCGIPPSPCPADTDGNGAVDVDDLVAVILDWGTSGAENGTDVDGSGLVDVDDVVKVILSWGPCE